MASYEQQGRIREWVTHKHLMWFALVMASLAVGAASVYIPPIVFIAAAFLIVGLIVLIKYPFIGLLLYMVTFVLRPGEMYPPLAPLAIERIIGVVVLIVALFHYKARHGTMRLPSNAVFVGLIAYLAVMLVTWTFSADAMSTQNAVIEFIKLIVFYLIIVYTIDTREKLNIFIGLFVLLMSREAFFSFRDYYGGGFVIRMGIQRAIGRGSFGSGANSLAATLVFTLPFAYAVFRVYKHRFIKLAALGIIGLCLLMIVNTGSRGGILALLAVMFATIWFSRYRSVALLAGIAVAVVGWFALPEQYQKRYLTMLSDDDVNEVSSGRVEIWENGLRMFTANPVLGVGAGAFLRANASGKYGNPLAMNAHSIYVQLLATVGLVGFIVWFGFLGTVVFRLMHQSIPRRGPPEMVELGEWFRAHKEAILVCTAGMLVSAIFAHSLFRFNWYMNAAVATSVVAIYWQERRRLAADSAESDTAIDESSVAEANGAPSTEAEIQ